MTVPNRRIRAMSDSLSTGNRSCSRLWTALGSSSAMTGSGAETSAAFVESLRRSVKTRPRLQGTVIVAKEVGTLSNRYPYREVRLFSNWRTWKPPSFDVVQSSMRPFRFRKRECDLFQSYVRFAVPLMPDPGIFSPVWMGGL